MKNEGFKAVGFWGSILAVIITVINIVLCMVNGFKDESHGSFFDVLDETAGLSYETVLFKVAVGIMLFSCLMLLISYVANTDGVLRVLMMIFKLAQFGCIVVVLYSGYVLYDVALAKLMLVVIAVTEIFSLILYLVDSDHRKCALKMALHALITFGAGGLFLIATYLIIIVATFLALYFLYIIFNDPAHRHTIITSTGRVYHFWEY